MIDHTVVDDSLPSHKASSRTHGDRSAVGPPRLSSRTFENQSIDPAVLGDSLPSHKASSRTHGDRSFNPSRKASIPSKSLDGPAVSAVCFLPTEHLSAVKLKLPRTRVRIPTPLRVLQKATKRQLGQTHPTKVKTNMKTGGGQRVRDKSRIQVCFVPYHGIYLLHPLQASPRNFSHIVLSVTLHSPPTTNSNSLETKMMTLHSSTSIMQSPM